MKADIYKPGELFVYTNGDRWELGMVKRLREDGKYACWYSVGDTVAVTPPEHMRKLENARYSRAACLSVGTILSHIPCLTIVQIQTEADEADGVCSYEGPALACPEELRELAVNIISFHSYCECDYLNISVR